MSIASADLHSAVNTLWDNSASLNNGFVALWPSSVTTSEHEALHDTEASAGQPFPYCVYEQGPGETITRMSKTATIGREIRDVPWIFRVHAKTVSGDSRTAKQIAAHLAGLIIKFFGGDPVDDPDDLVIANGGFLISQYQNDYGVRTGEDEYQWVIEYLFRLDVPVAHR